MDDTLRPKLLFFRLTCPGLPAFVCLHLQEQVKCLSQFFDVVVIDSSCDYRRLCDEHQPDLAVFESGVYTLRKLGQREIPNISAYPEIPKLGFCHCDAQCQSREGFLSDMSRWGVETFFTTSVSLPAYTPSLADQLFVWPNFVDPALYHDYGLAKVIPVLFTGSQNAAYPWRNRVNRILPQHYACLQSPHFGWADERTTSRTLFGEAYARLTNAAWIAPTCGTFANDLVRKHFEIPACNTCLVTQRTPGLEAAGFSDGVNCLFVDAPEILDRFEWLFDHPDELQRITRAGYDLVQSQHTIRQRDQVFQWFSLYKQLKPGQRVVQPGPFLPMTIVDQDSPVRTRHLDNAGLDRALLARGDEYLWSGRYDEAEALYRRCLNYYFAIPEPKLRLALCGLYRGKPDLAIRWVSDPIQDVLGTHRAAEPDPVEWAYFIVALLCLGRRGDAAARASHFQALRHPELDRVRTVIQMLGCEIDCGSPSEEPPRYRPSLHQLPERPMEAWLNELCKILKACRQDRMVERLARSAAPAATPDGTVARGPSNSRRSDSAGSGVGVRARLSVWRVDRMARISALSARAVAALKKRLKNVALLLLGRVEARIGYFLPYKWSTARNDERVSAFHRLLREEDIESGLLIGASAGQENTQAFLAGMNENQNKPSVVCANTATRRFIKLQKKLANRSSVQCRCLSSENGWHEDQIDRFDAVVIDGSEFSSDIGLEWTQGARLVVLDDINTLPAYKICQTLLSNREYTLLAHNPSHRGGYAIFKKALPRRRVVKNLVPRLLQEGPAP